MDALRRPPVPDDVVHYQLFLVRSDPTEARDGEPELLQNLLEKILAEFAPLLVQYIWQHEPFNIKYHPLKGRVPAHIGGSTKFGDNVEDEWFIVYLLQQITRTFPQLAARVQDNDGEFLLIEAANYLPKWLNPENSENRVFFYQGELHILPNPSHPGDLGWPRDVVPSEAEALTFLSMHKEACLADHRIQSAVGKRIEGYPGKIQAHLHRASCFVPAGIAAVLASRPDLLAPAVSAFYLRDPLDLQACRTFHTFPPDTCVMTSVVFTRCLYAQLQQQRFTPDCRSGFKLPAPSHPQYRSYDLGMKLAHGFEILCAKCRLPSSDKEAPVSCNPLWRGFMESLKKNDYFRGEMEGSARYRILMAQTTSFGDRTPGEEVLEVLHSASFNIEELKEQEAHLPPEDSDSWLDISPQELEHLLEEKAGWGADTSNLSKVDSAEGAKYDEASYNLVAVTRGVKNFINTISSHEGAELPCSQQNGILNPTGCQGAELDSDDLEDDDCDSDDDPTVRSVGQYPDLKEEAKEDALGTLKKYMDQMDLELKDTNIGKSFVKPEPSEKSDIPEECQLHPGAVELQGEDEEIQPLDVDLNLVTNLLESLSSQEGLAGPASNLLQSMGFHVPQNSDET
uniref:Ecdysoneless homolog (Drosophila) n=1 Tax=Scleropages formosus TaxID=113540 RepID=A0A8C9RIA8_SCLFO